MDHKTKSKLIARSEKLVRKHMSSESTGHDWYHARRVADCALTIAKIEGGDIFVIELAALLHDFEDWKLSENQDLEATKTFLTELQLTKEIAEQILSIIRNVSFKGAGVSSKIESLEGRIVQDADRLDALGAIGIARTFAYGGKKGSLLHDPEMKPVFHKSFEQYKSSNSTSVNHFHEKLFLLKDRMNTQTGRRIAESRHTFMQYFLKRFEQEWNGQDTVR